MKWALSGVIVGIGVLALTTVVRGSNSGILANGSFTDSTAVETLSVTSNITVVQVKQSDGKICYGIVNGTPSAGTSISCF